MSAVERFTPYWIAETLRLRETHWGPLEDEAEARRARAEGRTFPQRVLIRARLLAVRETIDATIQKWVQGSKLALLALALAAVLSGAGAALGALGDGSHTVNLVLALTALLGLHCLTFLFWLVGLAFSNDHAGAWLGQAWLWLTQKLARGPEAALAPRALLGLMGRSGALRWFLGAISHGIWLAALLAMLLTLIASLAARRYGFHWETTLLSSDFFVQLTTALGWLPSLLGFAQPGADVVRVSDGLHRPSDAAGALWSSWLIGCVVVYGLLPRLAGLGICLIMAARRIRLLTVEESLPGYADLRQRLSPTSERIGVDAPDGADVVARITPASLIPAGESSRILVGIELPPDSVWPPADIPVDTVDAGVIDSRPQRKRLLEQLQERPPAKLLIVCDSRQTPDRGTMALITDLAALAGDTHLALPMNDHDTVAHASRRTTWLERLEQSGLPASTIHKDIDAAMSWLATDLAEHEHD